MNPKLLERCPGNYDSRFTLWHVTCSCTACASYWVTLYPPATLECPLCNRTVTGLSLDLTAGSCHTLMDEERTAGPTVREAREKVLPEGDS